MPENLILDDSSVELGPFHLKLAREPLLQVKTRISVWTMQFGLPNPSNGVQIRVFTLLLQYTPAWAGSKKRFRLYDWAFG
ncbi:hypothetical protein Lalb_Chr10g0100661 [Lupinus albus]|uniref:Uncharacterized protein n=1 Tax=Lupinus albus TaxID=3870 RepID=A0A6A4PW79_LUPAL|nr:hypothetical protein Lalb_Chr10g0100661 [Lupinus albus]